MCISNYKQNTRDKYPSAKTSTQPGGTGGYIKEKKSLAARIYENLWTDLQRQQKKTQDTTENHCLAHKPHILLNHDEDGFSYVTKLSKLVPQKGLKMIRNSKKCGNSTALLRPTLFEAD
jgi:hypothetical protein